MRALASTLIVGAACWIVSEVIELASGSRTVVTLYLTAVFHLLVAGGIWAAYAGQRGPRSRASLVAAGAASAGYLLLVYPPMAVARDLSIDYVELLRARPLFMVAALLVTGGVTLFGAATLQARSYPAWIGLACLVSPVAFAAVTLANGPVVLGFAANTLLGAAFITMGVRALRTQTGEAGPS